jgi:hypothetical protein
MILNKITTLYIYIYIYTLGRTRRCFEFKLQNESNTSPAKNSIHFNLYMFTIIIFNSVLIWWWSRLLILVFHLVLIWGPRWLTYSHSSLHSSFYVLINWLGQIIEFSYEVSLAYGARHFTNCHKFLLKQHIRLTSCWCHG